MSLDKAKIFAKDEVTAAEAEWLRSNNLYEAWDKAGEDEPQKGAKLTGGPARRGAEAEDDEAPEQPDVDAELVAGGEPEGGYDNMEFNDLRALAKDRGLSAGGSAVEIVARLREQDRGND